MPSSLQPWAPREGRAPQEGRASSENRDIAWVFAGLACVTAAALAVVIAFDLAGVQEAEWSTSDPAFVAELPPYVGFLSNAGVLAWAFAAAIAWWSLAVLTVDRPRRTFLLSGAVVTTVMLLDDLFMLHEWVIPAYTGIHENVVLAALALLAASFGWVNRGLLRHTPWPLLAAAVVGLGVMLVLDLLEHSTSMRWHVVYEEGAKFAGLLAWCSYLVLTSLYWAREQPLGRRPAAE